MNARLLPNVNVTAVSSRGGVARHARRACDPTPSWLPKSAKEKEEADSREGVGLGGQAGAPTAGIGTATGVGGETPGVSGEFVARAYGLRAPDRSVSPLTQSNERDANTETLPGSTRYVTPSHDAVPRKSFDGALVDPIEPSGQARVRVPSRPERGAKRSHAMSAGAIGDDIETGGPAVNVPVGQASSSSSSSVRTTRKSWGGRGGLPGRTETATWSPAWRAARASSRLSVAKRRAVGGRPTAAAMAR